MQMYSISWPQVELYSVKWPGCIWQLSMAVPVTSASWLVERVAVAAERPWWVAVAAEAAVLAVMPARPSMTVAVISNNRLMS
jgi:hypothetical protein